MFDRNMLGRKTISVCFSVYDKIFMGLWGGTYIYVIYFLREENMKITKIQSQIEELCPEVNNKRFRIGGTAGKLQTYRFFVMQL